MYNYEIKTSFFSPEVPKAPAKKTGFKLLIVHFYIRRKLDRHSFFVWIRTGSYLPDSNEYEKTYDSLTKGQNGRHLELKSC